MELKKTQIIFLGIAAFLIILSLILVKTRFFFLLMGAGIITGVFPFVISLINESRRASEKEEIFLEFARDLVESVKTGTPISKSIVNMKNKDYGILSDNVKKLANQIRMGIPLGTALGVFSADVDNKTISRALSLIGQAEKSGGDIGQILEAVAEAVRTSDKLKKERRAAISTLVAQGYIIFFVFIVIILVLQFKIIPLLSGIGTLGAVGPVQAGGGVQQLEVANAFFYLLIIQGFFSGLVIGALAEGNIKAGIKHSFLLMILSFMVSAGANVFLG
ncbi:MAG: type II secretion system F family protein [archaeon]